MINDPSTLEISVSVFSWEGWGIIIIEPFVSAPMHTKARDFMLSLENKFAFQGKGNFSSNLKDDRQAVSSKLSNFSPVV